MVKQQRGLSYEAIVGILIAVFMAGAMLVSWVAAGQCVPSMRGAVRLADQRISGEAEVCDGERWRPLRVQP